MYLPIMEMGAFIGPPNPETRDFTAAMGVTLLSDPDNLEGSRESFLRAWNPVTQQLAWEHKLPGHWPAGILATAGDLVFQGTLDGHLKAYHRSEEHTSELQSRGQLVCRLLLAKKERAHV